MAPLPSRNVAEKAYLCTRCFTGMEEVSHIRTFFTSLATVRHVSVGKRRADFDVAGASGADLYKAAAQEAKSEGPQRNLLCSLVLSPWVCRSCPHAYRVGAYTGCAAFNVRYSASTLHRLFEILNPFHFADLPEGSTKLHEFQTKMANTHLLIFDEISMIGRQIMGQNRCSL